MWTMANGDFPASLRGTSMNKAPELAINNRYELDQMADGFSAFVETYPSFNRTLQLDEWRKPEKRPF